jgi:lipopolysaccharide export system permease protein
MKLILQRYMGVRFLLPFVASCLFFTFFLMSFRLFKITEMVITKGLGLGVVLELTIYLIIYFLPAVIPISLFFAMIFSLNRLSEDSEIVVMRSIGISRFQLLSPFLVLGIILAIVVYFLNNSLVPASNKELRRGTTKLASKGMLADIKRGHFYTDIPNVVLFASNVTERGQSLSEVFIHMRTKDGKGEKVIVAKHGFLKKEGEDDWGAVDLRLRLEDGNIVDFAKSSERVEKIHFQAYDFPLTSSQLGSEISTKDSMRSNRELWKIMHTSKEEMERLQMDKRSIIRSSLELYSRLNASLQCVLLVVLGLGLGVVRSRGGSKIVAWIAFGVLVAYYALLFLFISFAQSGKIPPSLAVFIPSFFCLLVAVKLYRRLEWVA